MLTFENFSGINNVLPEHRLSPSELRSAINVDVGLSSDIRRRQGFAELSGDCHKNLHQRQDGVLLATELGNALIARDPTGSTTTIHPLLGPARVWYCDLPDGRTLFTNGALAGLTDGAVTTSLGVPLPAEIGTTTDVAGALTPGTYRWALTHVRLADGLEGGPIWSEPVALANGGLVLMDLPELPGHKLRVYLTTDSGETFYLAGETTTPMFSFTAATNTLVVPLATDRLVPLPAGICPAFWRGRVLMAQDDVLWASPAHRYELLDRARDFKRFKSAITAVVPVGSGIWVGTETELVFLAGESFDQLTHSSAMVGRVVPGSAVPVPGEFVAMGEGALIGDAMVCICGGVIVAGSSSGRLVRLTEGRYKTDVQEVSATFRMRDRVPQYLAVSQV